MTTCRQIMLAQKMFSWPSLIQINTLHEYYALIMSDFSTFTASRNGFYGGKIKLFKCIRESNLGCLLVLFRNYCTSWGYREELTVYRLFHWPFNCIQWVPIRAWVQPLHIIRHMPTVRSLFLCLSLLCSYHNHNPFLWCLF